MAQNSIRVRPPSRACTSSTRTTWKEPSVLPMLSCSSQYANSSILNYPSSDAVIGNDGRVSGLYLRRFGSRIVQVYDYEMCRVFAIKSARYDTPISIVSYKFEAISRARNLGLVPRHAMLPFAR